MKKFTLNYNFKYILDIITIITTKGYMMSLKENVDYIKKEISTEESFMESFFKLEKFYKKYKVILFSAIALIVVSTIGYYINNYIAMQNKIEANKAFNLVVSNPSDKDSLEILKQKNIKLYNIALFMQNKPASDVEFLSDLSAYSKAIKQNNIDKIFSLTQNQDFLLKDFALLNKAILETQKGDFASAKETIQLISNSSQISALSKMLSHFLLTK